MVTGSPENFSALLVLMANRSVFTRVDAAPIAVLVTLHSPVASSATESTTATREVLIGCVKPSPGFVRKVSSQK